MDSFKNKIEKNTEFFNSQVSRFQYKKEEMVKSNVVFERLINWVTGEFDLYLKNESEILEVYLPNGWFSIRNFKNENNKEVIEIRVEGKSRIACQKVMNQLEFIFNHVVRFSEARDSR